MRDCRPAFNPELTYLLEPLPGAHPLSEVVDFTQTNLGVCSGVFENSLGGRIAVIGYFPWSLIQSLPKSTQLKTLFRWLTRDQFPAYIASYSSAALWLRRDAQGRGEAPWLTTRACCWSRRNPKRVTCSCVCLGDLEYRKPPPRSPQLATASPRAALRFCCSIRTCRTATGWH